MTISRLELTEFTVFKKARLEFCPGINVLIGENGTGKSHVLKLIYSALRAAREDMDPARGQDRLFAKLQMVFRPEDRELSRLIRRGSAGDCRVHISEDMHAEPASKLVLGRQSFLGFSALKRRGALFVPPREVLAMYRGFVAAYEGRELDFDETYYDVCKALSAAPLRGPRAKAIEAMLAPLEQIIGGRVVLAGDRFFVKQADGETEAHLVAEGLRKIAGLAYLVANGALARDGVLFWDEPEASLNPSLVVKVVDFLRTLASSGVQVFLASHDFLLVHRLSQAAEYGVLPAVPVRFFSLYRPQPGAAVDVEQGDVLVDLEHNAILDEFARYYDREQVLATQTMRGEGAAATVVPGKPKTAAKQATRARTGGAKQQSQAATRKVAKKVIRA